MDLSLIFQDIIIFRTSIADALTVIVYDSIDHRR
jgi:hypothetical protein